jgi:hypothetical protein
VVASVDNQDLFTQYAGDPFGDHRSVKAGADD